MATQGDQLVLRLLLCLRDGIQYGHRLEERLGELGFEEMRAGEMYRILWQMEQEGMVICDREGGGFRLPQRWYELTEAGETYLESCAGSLTRYGRRRTPSHGFDTRGPGRDRG